MAPLKIDGEHTGFTSIKRGLGQGVVFSLFVSYTAKWFFETSNILRVKESVEKTLITWICWPHSFDSYLQERSVKGIRCCLRGWGEDLNLKKSECMISSQQKNVPTSNLIREWQPITPKRDNFKYLGYTTTYNWKDLE